jgi:hypothetical protein
MDREIGGTDSTRIPVKMGKPVQEMSFARVVRYRTYATKSGLLLMGPSDVLLAMKPCDDHRFLHTFLTPICSIFACSWI